MKPWKIIAVGVALGAGVAVTTYAIAWWKAYNMDEDAFWEDRESA